jgi:hypothetical protein
MKMRSINRKEHKGSDKNTKIFFANYYITHFIRPLNVLFITVLPPFLSRLSGRIASYYISKLLNVNAPSPVGEGWEGGNYHLKVINFEVLTVFVGEGLCDYLACFVV